MYWIQRWFEKIAAAVRSESSAIQNALQDNKNAIDAAKISQDNAWSSIGRQISEMRSDDEYKRGANTYKHKSYWQQVTLNILTAVLTVATIGAFGAAAYYAREAHRQLVTMNNTYGEMKNQTTQLTIQAGEISKQTKLLHDQLSGTQGADLNSHVNGAMDDGRFSFGITNEGKNRPENIRLNLTFAYLDAISGKPVQRPTVLHEEWPTWRADNFAIQTMSYQPQVFRLGSPIWQRFTNGGLVLRTTGTLSWPNGFGDPRSIDICFQEFALTDPQQPNGNIYQHRGPFQCDQRTLREDFTRIAQRVVGEKASLKAEQEARHKH